MDTLRTLIIASLLVISYMMILAWNEDYGTPPTPSQPISEELTSSSVSEPVSSNQSSFNEMTIPGSKETAGELSESVNVTKERQLITVKTDVLEVKIDPVGGQVVYSALRKYPVSLNDPTPLVLQTTEGRTFTAESALIGVDSQNQKWTDAEILYSSNEHSYELKEGDEVLKVQLSTETDQKSIVKTFTFKPSDYLISLDYTIKNNSASAWKGYFAAKLVRDQSPDPTQSAGVGASSFLGAIISTKDAPYEKFSFSDMEKVEAVESSDGWIAFNQHYFLSAWVPESQQNRKFQIKAKGNQFLMGYVESQNEILPGATLETGAKLYVGPKVIELLDRVHPNLALTVDFGWLWLIAKPLYLVLEFMHDFVGNWGLAIILLTISIKAVFFHLSAASYRSMANMRRVAPELTRLKEQYGDDRQRMSQAMMELYRKEKINPLGGCLPILVQMPVFIALYWVLLESVELRQAPFFGWIQDLSIKDPYFILPLLMGATMFIQMKLNPTPPDPVQARVMQLMPVIFTVFFLWFPAGLVLYWFVNNLLSIAQQWVITRKIENEGSKSR
ncbi:MAG: membrane protein insertase YidC [Hahellaceae bacterium]|jgi:YidC/Oxa1 family membrane protein insertase|nr:membrane protein insertase YidC [Hahellaceae bacterium]